ncbi:nucleotidyltransferase domain-containing protein [bacterium]|nr:nucleotidyltransferase domain-containing protein [bacterium]
MTDQERGIIEHFRALLAERVGKHELTLFGSRVRGDADPDSDMDVLVVVDGAVDAAVRDSVSECAWEACWQEGIVVAPVTVSKGEWEEGPERESLLAIAVRAEGLKL